MSERRGPWNSLSQIVGRIEDLESAIAALLELDWQNSVLSRFDPTAATPVGPSTGDRYISTATANGWTDEYIYEWSGTAWTETIPNEGYAAWVEDENKVYVFDGATWVAIGSTTDHNILANLQGGTASEYYHLTQVIYDMFSFSSGNLFIKNLNHGAEGKILLQGENNAGAEREFLVGDPDDATYLYHPVSDQIRLATTTVGVNVFSGTAAAVGIGENGGTHWIHGFVHGEPITLRAEDSLGVSQNLFVGDPDGAAELYHAGVKTFETTAIGADFFGATANSQLTVREGSGGNWSLVNVLDGKNFTLAITNGLSVEQTGFTIDNPGNVQRTGLYYDGALAVTTTTDGLNIGSAALASITHESDTTLSLRNKVHGGAFDIRAEDLAGNLDYLFNADPDGSAEIYHAGELKFNTDTQYLNGIQNASDVAVSSDGGTPPTITFTFTGTVYVWSDGIRYAKTGSENIQITDVNGTHVIYYNGSTLTVVANPSHDAVDAIIEDKAIVAIVYWNTNSNVTPILACELHGIKMPGATHHYLHDTRGAQYEEGAGLSGYTLNTASDAAISFDLTDLEFYDEDIQVEVIDGSAAVQYEQVLTGDAEIPVLYKDAVDQSWVEQAASTLPYIVGGTPSIQYMDKDNSFALTEVASNKWCSYWLVATNDWQYPIKMIPGDQEYNSINDALQNAQDEILNFGDLPAAEFIVMYQFIMKRSAGGTKNALISAIVDLRESGKSGTAANPATDHGGLTGLGDDDHTQYALLAGRDAQQQVLDPALTTDLTATGKVVSMTVDVNATGIGAALYMAADFHLEEADADASATMPCIALALEAGTGTKTVLLEGFIRNDAWAWTAGPIYVSTTTGALTQTAPSGTGDRVQRVGWAYSADIMFFDPDSTDIGVA